jgi:hypothetical protein
MGGEFATSPNWDCRDPDRCSLRTGSPAIIDFLGISGAAEGAERIARSAARGRSAQESPARLQVSVRPSARSIWTLPRGLLGRRGPEREGWALDFTPPRRFPGSRRARPLPGERPEPARAVVRL